MKLKEFKSYDVISYDRFGNRNLVAGRIGGREADRILSNMQAFYSRLVVEESKE